MTELLTRAEYAAIAADLDPRWYGSEAAREVRS